MDVASEMVYPILPLFLASLLASPGVALGAIEGVAEALLSVLTALTGWRSDRIRRRMPFIRWGYALAAAAKPLPAFARGWPLILFARALDRFGKGLRTAARDAWIADIVKREQLGRAFGLHRAMDTAGAVAGVLLALALVHLLPGNYRAIFQLTLVPGAIGVLLTLTLREPPPATRDASGAIARPTRLGRGLPATFWRAVAPLWIFALANSSDAFLLLRAKDFGGSDASAVFAYALFNFTYMLVSWPAGILSDRVGRWPLLIAGWLLYAAVYAGFAATTGAGIWPCFVVYGVFMGLTQGVARALIADHAPAELRATALGTYHLGVGLATLASSLVAGWAWDHVSHAAPFWIGSGGAMVALLLLPLGLRAKVA
jgi:MFS family permease